MIAILAMTDNPDVDPVGRLIERFVAKAREELDDRLTQLPVVLEEDDWPVWLGERLGNVAALLHAPAADMLQCQPVRGKARTARDNRRDAADVAATLAF